VGEKRGGGEASIVSTGVRVFFFLEVLGGLHEGLGQKVDQKEFRAN